MIESEHEPAPPREPEILNILVKGCEFAPTGFKQ